MNDIMKISNLSLSYDDNLIIDDVDLSFESKMIHAILAPNNSGKTSIIKALSGIEKSKGKIVIDDVTLNKNNLQNYIMTISTILDDIDNEFLCDNVLDEIKYPLLNLQYKNKKMNSIIDKAVDITNIKSILDKNIDNIKLYEKIKVLLAASIVHNPKVLLLDDIFRFMNKRERRIILNILNNIKEEYNLTIIFTTSNLEDVIGLSSIYVFNKGKIVMHDDYGEIVKKDNELSKMGILIPLMVDLSRKLQFYNLIDYIYYDRDMVVNKLWK